MMCKPKVRSLATLDRFYCVFTVHLFHESFSLLWLLPMCRDGGNQTTDRQYLTGRLFTLNSLKLGLH